MFINSSQKIQSFNHSKQSSSIGNQSFQLIPNSLKQLNQKIQEKKQIKRMKILNNSRAREIKSQMNKSSLYKVLDQLKRACYQLRSIYFYIDQLIKCQIQIWNSLNKIISQQESQKQHPQNIVRDIIKDSTKYSQSILTISNGNISKNLPVFKEDIQQYRAKKSNPINCDSSKGSTFCQMKGNSVEKQKFKVRRRNSSVRSIQMTLNLDQKVNQQMQQLVQLAKIYKKKILK